MRAVSSSLIDRFEASFYCEASNGRSFNPLLDYPEHPLSSIEKDFVSYYYYYYYRYVLFFGGKEGLDTIRIPLMYDWIVQLARLDSWNSCETREGISSSA